MNSGGPNTTQSDPHSGFVPDVLAPLMKVVGLGISANGGILGPMLASGGDFISQARDDRLRSDVWANLMPGLLAGVQRSREISPGKPEVPGTPGTPDVDIGMLVPGAARPTIPLRPPEPSAMAPRAAVGPDEEEFQRWYNWRSNQFGLDLNPDAARQYDYRAAFRAGKDVDPVTGQWPVAFQVPEAPVDQPYEIPLSLPGQPPTPGVPAIPPVTRTWESAPTLAEALARLQERGGSESTRALAVRELARMRMPGGGETPEDVKDERDRARLLEDEARRTQQQRAEEQRRAPIFSSALTPGASPAALGGAAAAGMTGIRPPTQAEQIQLEEITRRRETGKALADQLRARAESLVPPVSAPPLPTGPMPSRTGASEAPLPSTAGALPPFSAFEKTPERLRSELMAAAAAAERGDPDAVKQGQALLLGEGPDEQLRRRHLYAQTARLDVPPAGPAYTVERLRLIAQGAITDPQISAKDALQALETRLTEEVRIARARAQATAEGREAGAPQMSSDALDMAARDYITYRQLPPMGMGGAAARAKILTRAAEIAKQEGVALEDLPTRRATLRALEGEMKKIQAQRGPIMAFAQTADYNLDLALRLSDRVPRTAIPQLNAWIQSAQTRWTGDPALAGFASAVRVGINETARVTSGQASGPTTDTARREIEGMLNAAQTPQAFREVISTLKQDMGNRRRGYDEQLRATQDGIRGLSVGAGRSQAAAPPPEATSKPIPDAMIPTGAHREGNDIVSDSGKYIWRGGQWQPRR